MGVDAMLEAVEFLVSPLRLYLAVFAARALIQFACGHLGRKVYTVNGDQPFQPERIDECPSP